MYHLKKQDKKIILFLGEENIFPEDYIKIEKSDLGDKVTVCEVHRNDVQVKIVSDSEEAPVFAAVFFKRMHDDIIDREKGRQIRNYVRLGEYAKALQYSLAEFEGSIYSIGNENNLKISLIQSEDDMIDIKYGGEYLAEKVSLSRGYVVLYNYCAKLKYISMYCDKLQRRLKCKLNQEKIKRCYILGKL